LLMQHKKHIFLQSIFWMLSFKYRLDMSINATQRSILTHTVKDTVSPELLKD
jgi:hypothetical protein